MDSNVKMSVSNDPWPFPISSPRVRQAIFDTLHVLTCISGRRRGRGAAVVSTQFVRCKNAIFFGDVWVSPKLNVSKLEMFFDVAIIHYETWEVSRQKIMIDMDWESPVRKCLHCHETVCEHRFGKRTISRSCVLKAHLCYTHRQTHTDTDTDTRTHRYKINVYIYIHTYHDWMIKSHQIILFMTALTSLNDCSIPQKDNICPCKCFLKYVELGCPSWPLVRRSNMTNHFDDDLGPPMI